jgi:hypothetical protein
VDLLGERAGSAVDHPTITATPAPAATRSDRPALARRLQARRIDRVRADRA